MKYSMMSDAIEELHGSMLRSLEKQEAKLKAGPS
jgi:hypothetical protein